MNVNQVFCLCVAFYSYYNAVAAAKRFILPTFSNALSLSLVFSVSGMNEHCLVRLKCVGGGCFAGQSVVVVVQQTGRTANPTLERENELNVKR